MSELGPPADSAPVVGLTWLPGPGPKWPVGCWAFSCRCGKTQAYAPEGTPHGITKEKALEIGWTRQAVWSGHGQEWLCPPCKPAKDWDREAVEKAFAGLGPGQGPEVRQRTSPRAENYILVSDLNRGTFVTSHGKPQEGIAFVCLEHGIQPFGGFLSPTDLPTFDLGCGCSFAAHLDGSLKKRKT